MPLCQALQGGDQSRLRPYGEHGKFWASVSAALSTNQPKSKAQRRALMRTTVSRTAIRSEALWCLRLFSRLLAEHLVRPFYH